MDGIIGNTSMVGHGEERRNKMATEEIIMAGSSCLSLQISVESNRK